MSRRAHALLALLLAALLPLRAIAALAMPCCPVTDGDAHAEMAMAIPSADESADGPGNEPGGATDGAAASHPGFDCCAFAMMALPAPRLVVSPYAPPLADPHPARPVVAFVTDPPERPPRPSTRAV